jgi:hypothetical protein
MNIIYLLYYTFYYNYILSQYLNQIFTPFYIPFNLYLITHLFIININLSKFEIFTHLKLHIIHLLWPQQPKIQNHKIMESKLDPINRPLLFKLSSKSNLWKLNPKEIFLKSNSSKKEKILINLSNLLIQIVIETRNFKASKMII